MTFDEFFYLFNTATVYLSVFVWGIVAGIILERWALTGRWSIKP